MRKNQLKYYLDTNAIQSLSSKLESIPTESVFTSIWTEIELVTAIKDESSFRRKRAALKHLQESGLYVDQTLSAYKRDMAFGAIEKTNYTFEEYIDLILVYLSIVPGLELLLKYQLYLILHTYYLNPIHVNLDFSENEINISDDTSLDLIT